MTHSKKLLPYRVDVYCSGGWQWLASFASETDAYEYGEGYSICGVRVWEGESCIAISYGRKSWRGPNHLRNCNGLPCECGAVPPLGSMSKGRQA